MAFQLSPGVLVTEKDLTLLVPSVSTTAGGFAGAFQWGPANEVVTVDSETTLVERFGKPNDNTYIDFFTAANFLSYGNNLQLIRTVDKSSALNSVGSANTASSSAVLVENEDDYTQNHSSGSLSIEWAAKYPGLLGNSLKVSLADANTFATWQYAANFDEAPNTSTYASTVGGANDELHVIVVDEDGAWTGTRGEVLERFSFVSKASDAKLPDGTSNYYKNVINNRSKYVWWLGHTGNVVTRNWGSAAAVSYTHLTLPTKRIV